MPAPTGTEKEELAVTLAALALFDDNAPITADKINVLLESANVSVQKFWPNLFAKTLSSRSHAEIGEIILGSGGSGGAVSAGPAETSSAGSASSAPAEEKKDDKKAAAKDDSEESEGDMGFGLFD